MKFVEYSKYSGKSQSSISQAIRMGKLTVFKDSDGKRYLDSELADAEFAGNTDPAMIRGKALAEQVDEEQAAAQKGHPISYATSRAEKERFNAELARLKFEEQSGKLIDAAEVQDQAFKLGRTVRDQLLSLPDRVAAELAGEDNAFKIHQRLTEEIRRALESFKVEELSVAK
jgi:phage terminase Nu1 subunit (DNA packaging protein)